ncbi:MAG: hypothetical protein JXB49_36095 [Bacteroidales bacterium]|nr:hypothetical protein [Bacteroidales bacterium]
MSENNTNGFKFESTDLVLYIWNKRKPLIIITVAAAILSIIISLTITPKFESTAIIFPADYSSPSRILLGQNYSTDHVLKFGDEEQLERMMQVLKSGAVSTDIIWGYNLMEHYGIDPNSKFKYSRLYKEYSDNVNFKKTKFMSITITVRDKDPQMAANIANDIVDMVDTAYHKIKQEQAMASYEIVRNEYNEVEKYMNYLEDSIRKIQALGVTNYEAQAERYSQAYATAIVEGKMAGARELEKKMAILAQYGESYMTLRDQLLHEHSRFSQVRSRLIEARVDAEQKTSYRFVVERAGVSDKKAYPKKAVIVITSTIAAFVFALLFMLLFDNIRRILKK